MEKIKSQTKKPENKLHYSNKIFIEQKPESYKLDINFNNKHVAFLVNNTESEDIVFIRSRIPMYFNKKRHFVACDLSIDLLSRTIFWNVFPIWKAPPSNLKDFIFDLKYLVVDAYNNLKVSDNFFNDTGLDIFPEVTTGLPIKKEKTIKTLEEFKEAVKIYYEVFSGMLDEKKKQQINYKIPETGIVVVDKSSHEKKLLDTLEEKSDKRFSDIGGYKKLKEKLKRVSEMKKKPKVFEKLGLKPPHGILLYGPPGTGKTLAASALSGEIGSKFYSIKSSDIFTKWLGESGKNMTNILNSLPDNSILFIDEIDSLMRSRDSSHETSAEVLNLILQFMDGLSQKDQTRDRNILIMGATNRKDILDKAALRAGRFSEQIEVGLPDKKAREQIFKICLENFKDNSQEKIFSSNIDFRKLALNSKNFSGSDINEVIRRAVEEKAFNKNKKLISTDSLNHFIKDIQCEYYKKTSQKIGF